MAKCLHCSSSNELIKLIISHGHYNYNVPKLHEEGLCSDKYVGSTRTLELTSPCRMKSRGYGSSNDDVNSFLLTMRPFRTKSGRCLFGRFRGCGFACDLIDKPDSLVVSELQSISRTMPSPDMTSSFFPIFLSTGSAC